LKPFNKEILMSRSIVLGFGLVLLGFAIAHVAGAAGAAAPPVAEKRMQLGNFSVSLTVKDINASQAFYEKLGFKVFMGNAKQRMVILQNDTATIGLFQGEFDKNILTFNPGWDRNAKALPEFDDVREIQKKLLASGVELSVKTDASATGPAGISLNDPDGNQILIDQHVPKAKK